MNAPRPVEFRGYWTNWPEIGHDWTPWGVWWRQEIYDPNELKDFRRGWVREVRMSDGSLVRVVAKRSWAIGDRVLLPKTDVVACISSFSLTGRGAYLRADSGRLHFAWVRDLRRVPDGR